MGGYCLHLRVMFHIYYMFPSMYPSLLSAQAGLLDNVMGMEGRGGFKTYDGHIGKHALLFGHTHMIRQKHASECMCRKPASQKYVGSPLREEQQYINSDNGSPNKK